MADKRVTMIKPVVGKVKSPAYALPENDFVYGIETLLDKEGAGEVVQSWAQSKPSEPPCSMQSFPATNRQALKNGCLTPRSQREYGKKFPAMKRDPKQSNRGRNPDEDPRRKAKIGEVIVTSIYQEDSAGPRQPNQSFGIPTKRSRVSMTELLRCIPAELDDETDYPDLSGKKCKGRLPPAKATKSSLIVAKCRDPPSQDEMARQKSVEEFKMTKFKNVQPRVKCYM